MPEIRKYSCLIADDEDLALALLKNYIGSIPFLKLEAEFHNGKEVLAYLEKNKVDILFLDIQMPYISGLELAEAYAKKSAVIITTAYPGHAVDSYALNVLDYLLKPFLSDRFEMAVQRAIDYVEYKLAKEAGSDGKNFIYVKTDHRLVKILFDEILYLEARKQYVMIKTVKEGYLVLDSMKNFENSLSPALFMRVHKSYIIALKKIQSMGSAELIINDYTIPVSKQYRRALQSKIG
jgi:DNA-binding LytR/AlgR family response regulator